MTLQAVAPTEQRTLSAERYALLGLLVLYGFAAGLLVHRASWLFESPLDLDELPKPDDPLAGISVLLLYTTQAMISAVALCRRRLSFLSLFCGALVALPIVGLHVLGLWTLGLHSLPIRISEFAWPIISGGASLLLLLPWLIRTLRWPARTPGHLAIGVAILVGVGLQVLFHLTLLVPGSRISLAEFEKTRAVVAATESPGEIERLIELGVAPMILMDPANLRESLDAVHAAHPDTAEDSLRSILSEAPRVLHAWDVPGYSKIDRILFVYDGRGLESGPEPDSSRTERQTERSPADGPLLWMLPPDTFLLPRAAALTAFYTLTAASSFVWMAGALLVHLGHSRRVRSPHPRAAATSVA